MIFRRAILFACCCASVALAEPDAEPLIRQADQALKTLDYRGAATAFERACSSSVCTHAQLLRATSGLANALASSGQSSKASEAFKVLLFISPGWDLPQGESPRLKDPFEQAQLFWRSRAQPGLALRVPSLAPEQHAVLTLELAADPLELVKRIVVRVRGDADETVLTGEGARTATGDGGFTLPLAFDVPKGHFTLVAQALSASGSVLLESAPIERDVSASSAPPPTVVTPPPADAVEKPEGRPLLNLGVAGVLDALNRQLGVEAMVGISPSTYFDLAAGADFGQSIGLRVTATVHLARGHRVSPLGQLRFGLHPVSGGPAVGGGLTLGAGLEAGPGRLIAMVGAELFHAPPTYAPWGVLVFLGYTVDLPFLRG